MKPVLLIDSNAVCHKVKHTLGDLTYETSRVGVMFGYLMQMLYLAKTYETHRLVHVWDSTKSHRVKFYPEYKEKRRTTKSEKTAEEKEEDALAYAQFDQLFEEVLPEIGFRNNYKSDGFEGDDLVASIIDNNPDDFLIVSGDEDMYQCLCQGVSIVRKKGLYTAADFTAEYGIPPRRWVEVKAIAGCKSDEVAGINGVGETTAIKYLLGELKPGSKKYMDIISQEGKAIIKRNLHLVTLPYPNTPQITLVPNEQLSLDGFVNVCNRYSFQHFLKKDELTKWKTYLNLK